jgi:ribonuclease E
MPDVKVLINASDEEEIRIATLKNGVLFDYDVEFIHNEKNKGNIYKAKIVKIDQSLQAAFVDYGMERNGFLPLAELPRKLVSEDSGRTKIQQLLKKDQEIMVQVIREQLGNKGAMVSAQISLAGRYLVVTPGNPINGISRKIEGSEERKEFKKMVDLLPIPDDVGVIVRTASLGISQEDFEKDLSYLLDIYSEITDRYSKQNQPGLVWREDDLVIRTLRDGFLPDTSEVLIDDLETFKRAQAFMKRTMPSYIPVLKHYVGKKNVFSKYQTEDQIELIYGRTIHLPSGGAIVIDQTEALVAIDVNSGKTTGDNQEETALKTNMDAAVEIARQLRLRDLAGLIAVDFIDMKRETNIKSVQNQLIDHLKEDKARMEVGKINRFGVLIMTRQRIRPSLQHINHESCIACKGTGKVKTKEAVLLEFFRKIRTAALREDASRMTIKMSLEIGLLMLNSKRNDISDLESKHGVKIDIQPDSTLHLSDFILEIQKHPNPVETTPSIHDNAVINPVLSEGELEAKDIKNVKIKSTRSRPNTGKQDRDKQRAALSERERLRSLFHDDKAEPVAPESTSKYTSGFDILGSIKSSVDSLVRKAKHKNKRSSVKAPKQSDLSAPEEKNDPKI